MPPVIGIPRTLAYYTFFPFWKTFFERLGCSVAVSDPTNRSILDAGVRDTVNDACVPIKLMHGHAISLADSVDYIFCPRLVSADGKSTFCPKFLGLPDMIRFSRSDLPPIIDTTYRMVRRRPSLFSFCRDLARPFNSSLTRVALAYASARHALARYRRVLAAGVPAGDAIAAVCDGAPLETPNHPDPGARLAVVGFPYLLNDPYILLDLQHRLTAMGIDTYTTDQLSDRRLRAHRRELPLDYFWYFSNRVAWSALHYLARPDIDGIIHVTAFGCGPDSMLNRVLDVESKRRNRPLLTVTVDEHTGEGGVLTRLEAFVDMLLYNKQAHPEREAIV